MSLVQHARERWSSVLALPAPEVFLSEAGLAAVGPKAFGFDIPFKSVFEGASA